MVDPNAAVGVPDDVVANTHYTDGFKRDSVFTIFIIIPQKQKIGVSIMNDRLVVFFVDVFYKPRLGFGEIFDLKHLEDGVNRHILSNFHDHRSIMRASSTISPSM